MNRGVAEVPFAVPFELDSADHDGLHWLLHDVGKSEPVVNCQGREGGHAQERRSALTQVRSLDSPFVLVLRPVLYRCPCQTVSAWDRH